MRHALFEAFNGLRRHKGMAVAVVVTMWVSLTLFGMGVLTAQQVDLIKGRWYDKIELTVFLCTPDSTGGTCTGENTTDVQRAAIESLLKNHPEVDWVQYQSKPEVYEEFRQEYAGSPILDTVKTEDMQDLFRIKLKNPEQYEGVRTAVEKLPGVQTVQDLREYLEPLFQWTKLGQNLAVGAALLLLGAAMLQIANTIRISAYSRRRELAIMKLVGASNWYILLPFLLESLIAALAGAALAVGTLAAFQQYVIVGKAEPAIETIAWITWGDVGIASMWVVGLAVLLSMIPTVIAARRYVRV